MSRARAILLMGPTGAGKTELAARLVERLPLEIVSVDSAMVYRGMDIGTAKPDAALLARAPHHLVDLIDPAERYSVGRFLADAAQAMQQIAARGKVPLLTGGTMLYFRALQSGLAALPTADAALRAELDQRATEIGWDGMHRELARLDPRAAARIAPGDRQRIQRSLEVIALTGSPLSSLHSEDLRGAVSQGDLRLVLAPADRHALAERLDARFRGMMDRGLLGEVQTLYARGDLHPGLPSIRLVGYRQLWEFLAGRISLDAAIEQAIIATRQLARRQHTWLRAEPAAEWLEADGPGLAVPLAARVARWLDAA